MVLKFLTIIFLLSVSPITGNAQLLDSKFTYYKSLYEISKAPLVIRLNMKKRTIAAYEKILANPRLSENEKIRTATMLDKLKINREQYKTVVMKAFDRHFTFTDVLFIENQNFPKLRKEEGGLLFNSDYEILDSIPNNYYVLIQGEHDLEWKLVDKNLNDLKSNIFDAGIGFKRVVNWVSGDSDANIEDMSNVAVKLNGKLEKFYKTRSLEKIIPRYFIIPYLL